MYLHMDWHPYVSLLNNTESLNARVTHFKALLNRKENQ